MYEWSEKRLGSRTHSRARYRMEEKPTGKIKKLIKALESGPRKWHMCDLSRYAASAPPNGPVLYTGTVETDDGKERRSGKISDVSDLSSFTITMDSLKKHEHALGGQSAVRVARLRMEKLQSYEDRRQIVIKSLNKEQEADQSHFKDQERQAESLLMWIANEYARFGCTLANK
ncbi:hypothetical protein R1sor_006779 [Riccia sorocarpa]|uniref:Uncharacterized protein n=1 Tax=Riccia sorocarpa TaxID=122646 RepID=A0ABD3HNW9_9MARC